MLEVCCSATKAPDANHRGILEFFGPSTHDIMIFYDSFISLFDVYVIPVPPIHTPTIDNWVGASPACASTITQPLGPDFVKPVAAACHKTAVLVQY